MIMLMFKKKKEARRQTLRSTEMSFPPPEDIELGCENKISFSVQIPSNFIQNEVWSVLEKASFSAFHVLEIFSIC